MSGKILQKKKQTVHRLLLDTYLAVIHNSVGCRMFRNFYAIVNGKKTDVMRNGELSCAFYISFLLASFGLAQGIHGTVVGTVQDLKKSGWRAIKKPRIGSILIWEAVVSDDGESHKHIGFYIGNEKAISNDSERKCPAIHHGTFDGARTVETILWNPKLK